jgi:hypothetical protein
MSLNIRQSSSIMISGFTCSGGLVKSEATKKSPSTMVISGIRSDAFMKVLRIMRFIDNELILEKAVKHMLSCPDRDGRLSRSVQC